MFRCKEKDIMKWINALYSNKYQQTTRRLQNSDGYCCLGVACKIFIPDNLLYKNRLGYIVGYTPLAQQNSPRWLKDINVDLYHRTGSALIDLNDTKLFSFSEIADVLYMVYILKVLD